MELLCCSYVTDADNTELMYGDTVEITESQYCFENECMYHKNKGIKCIT